MSCPSLRIYAWMPAVYQVLGPGLRAVVWVQGCSLRCPGCMVPETWATTGGQLVDPIELADYILVREDIEGVTISGGEPTEQPAAVARLLARVKAAGKNTWVYSGYTLRELLDRRDPATDEMLSLIDVLVDGRYDINQAGRYPFRGSMNQNIIHLTHAIASDRVAQAASSAIEVQIDQYGHLVLIGIPPPGFLPQLLCALRDRGVNVSTDVPWK